MKCKILYIVLMVLSILFVISGFIVFNKFSKMEKQLEQMKKQIDNQSDIINNYAARYTKLEMEFNSLRK